MINHFLRVSRRLQEKQTKLNRTAGQAHLLTTRIRKTENRTPNSAPSDRPGDLFKVPPREVGGGSKVRRRQTQRLSGKRGRRVSRIVVFWGMETYANICSVVNVRLLPLWRKNTYTVFFSSNETNSNCKTKRGKQQIFISANGSFGQGAHFRSSGLAEESHNSWPRTKIVFSKRLRSRNSEVRGSEGDRKTFRTCVREMSL